ncbi:hypothetical protein C8Q76DRAFT_802325 [Earliella scabrosa]|nr:hypothetical protein C8Q76DRAFT_802325 [Earliella scabrosa]
MNHSAVRVPYQNIAMPLRNRRGPPFPKRDPEAESRAQYAAAAEAKREREAAAEAEDLWEQTLEPQLIAALDDLRVPWHSLVPVRMKYTDEEIGAPVTVMVCVERACEVRREDAEGAARRCVELL